MTTYTMTADTPPWELYSYEALIGLMAGNADAVRFLLDIAKWSHVYDDLIDGDKAVEDVAIHDTFWTLLVSMPTNPFFRMHQDAIRPVLVTAILNWRAANDMEKSQCEEELRVAHVLRYALADLALLCMVLTGGHEHAAKNAKKAALLGRGDTWQHYASEHKHKKGADDADSK